MAKLYGSFRFHEKVEIIAGRLKGEIMTVVGETNLNMDYRIIINRKKGKDRQLGISPHQLRKCEKG